MSGGGVFTFRSKHPETIKLVGIMIEHHKVYRVMVVTRASVVAARAREVIERHSDAFR
jgi:hypothetical protein